MSDEQMVLLTEKCTERGCGRFRYSELTDDANTHWHVKRGAALVPVALLAASPSTSPEQDKQR